MSNKIYRKWNFKLYLSLKKEERKREREREKESGAKTSSNFKNISKTPEKFSPVKLVTNYHKLSRVPIVVRPWGKFEKQKLVLNFESCYCYFKWVIFS